MARKHEAEGLLRQGFAPSQIAKEMGISTAAVVQYLCLRVGEGGLKVSDIFFAIPKDIRAVFETAISEKSGRTSVNWRKLPKDSDREEFQIYMQLRAPSHLRGDLYEHLSEIEVKLHDLVRRELKRHFGDNDWWWKGVPLNVREDCALARQRDDDPIDDEFSYTTLINLKAVIDKHWSVFKSALPKHWADNKPALIQAFNRLNIIRNAVMHPVKKRPWTQDDFDFVRDFRRGLVNGAGSKHY
jgi:hypothetical protein